MKKLFLNILLVVIYCKRLVKHIQIMLELNQALNYMAAVFQNR